tara:strand:+ start:7424 stop:8281 length:858 start_codon:yes stop_codon:yes gene_type:complete
MSNSKEAYNNVEISQEEMSAINGEQTTVSEETPKEEALTVEDNSTREVTNPEGSDSDYVYQVEIDGKSYSTDDVAKWKADSDNKSNWSKSNTEKAQKIAGVGKFIEKFNGDEKLQEHLKSYFEDEKEYDSLGLEGNDIIERVPEEPSVNDTRLDRLERAEYNRIVEHRTSNLEQELSSLEEQYPNILGDNEKVMDFLQFAENNSARYRDSKGVVNLSHMFKEYSFDHMKSELSHFKKLNDNSNRNVNTVINRSEIGAVETVTPTSYKSWKEIDGSDPDIKKYFDE